jgi:hypothetical protein
MIDAMHDFNVVVAIPSASYTTDQDGATIDLAGYSGAAIVALPVGVAGAHSLTIQETANGTTWSNVGAGDLIGSYAALSANTPQKVAYVGNKRYIQVLSTDAGGAAVFGVIVIRRSGRKEPVS